jgi:hypothetical protein
MNGKNGDNKVYARKHPLAEHYPHHWFGFIEVDEIYRCVSGVGAEGLARELAKITHRSDIEFTSEELPSHILELEMAADETSAKNYGIEGGFEGLYKKLTEEELEDLRNHYKKAIQEQ